MWLSEFYPKFVVRLKESDYTSNEVSALFRYLLRDFFGIDYVRFQLDDLKLLPTQVQELEQITIQLSKHKPYEYLLGYVDFFELPIRVNEHTLIPRPETAHLVAHVLEQKKAKSPAVLDICTGSGCIALAVKNAWEDATVQGLELSQLALNMANKNAKRLNLEVDFRLQDIIDTKFQLQAKKWDIIISNPPYVMDRERSEMSANVLEYEPHLALFVDDENPLVFYHRIAQLAFDGLKKNGELYLEINAKLAPETKSAVEAAGFSKVVLLENEFRKEFRFLKASR